jgi:predicted ATP-dependent endonuclease of OLD family
MYVRKVRIDQFRLFKRPLEFSLGRRINVIIGPNDSGNTSILLAINGILRTMSESDINGARWTTTHLGIPNRPQNQKQEQLPNLGTIYLDVELSDRELHTENNNEWMGLYNDHNKNMVPLVVYLNTL